MISKKLDEELTKTGYRPLFPYRMDASVYWKEFRNITYLICFLEDDGVCLRERSYQDIMEDEVNRCSKAVGGGNIFPIGIVITSSLEESRKTCKGSFACWYLEVKSRKLIIFDDQPAECLDLRKILEQYLSSGKPLVEKHGLPQSGSKRTRIFQLTPVNTGIVLINVICFFILELMGDTTDNYFMYQHGAMLISEMNRPDNWYRALTCNFLHFGLFHLLSNMIVLLYLGDNLERLLGPYRYVWFYLLAGIGSSVISVISYSLIGQTNVLSAGASGAIFGVVGGLLYIVLKNRGRVEDLSGIQLILLIVFTLYHGFTGLSGINNSAHIGGLLIGIVMAAVLYRKEKRREKNG